MKNMNLFGEQSSNFEEILLNFAEEINPAYKQRDSHLRYSGMDQYLESLYNKGKLVHSDMLDNFVASLFTIDQEEFDISYGYHEAQKLLLLNDIPLEKVYKESRDVLEAVATLYKRGERVNLDEDLRIAKLLYSSNYKRFMRYSTNKGYLIKESVGLSIYKVRDILLRSNNLDAILSMGYDIFDTYNIAAKCTELGGTAEALEEAHRFMAPFIGKEYLFEVANTLRAIYKDNLQDLPHGEDLWDLMVLNELKESSVELSSLLSYYNIVESYPGRYNIEKGEWNSLVHSVYNTGFSIAYMQHDSYDKGAAYFCELARLSQRASVSFKSYKHYHMADNRPSLYKKKGLDYYYDKKEYTLLESDKLLELFRYVYDYVSLNQIEQYSDYDFTVDSILKWLSDIAKYANIFTNSLKLETILHSDFSEIQIFSVSNGCSIPLYHIPHDFFIEYCDEIAKAVKAIAPKYCAVSVQKIQHEKNVVQVLVLVFSDSTNVSYSIQNSPLDLYMDISVKSNLVFKSGNRVSTPVLKKMLYQTFKDAGKETDCIEALDAQTVVALAQALVLQDSEEYKQLFSLQNSFLSGFHMLKWFIRPDDNFFSAVLRYVLAVSGVYSYYSNNKISKDLKGYVVAAGKEYDLMSIFHKDLSLVDYLKTHSVMLELKGDVIYFT